MKKHIKNTLLSTCVAIATLTASVATISLNKTVSADVSTETTRFEMVDGAAIRLSKPNGLRFIAEMGSDVYNDLTTKEDGVTKKMGMFIMPYDYVVDAVKDNYANITKKINHVFYDSDSDVNKIYEEDGYYRANGVISNLKLANYDREFVGIAYISETKNGVTTYTYADFDEADDVRSALYVANAAYEDYKDNSTATSIFMDYALGAYLSESLDGEITENVSGADAGKVVTYTYNDNTYNTLKALSEANGYVSSFSVKLNVPTTIFVGKQENATATIVNGTKEVTFESVGVFWSSSNENAVKVDKNGVLTAVGGGEATISASFMGATASAKVSVFDGTFESGVVPTAFTKADTTASLDIVEKDGSKVLQLTNSGTSPAMKVTVEFLKSFFDDASVDYIAFDAKADINMNNFRRDTNRDGALTAVTYEHDMSYTHPVDGKSYPTTGIRADSWKTFYFSRADYNFWVSQGVSSARFIASGGFSAGKNVYIDNIRSATAEERAVSGYRFESIGIRVNDTNGKTLLFYTLDNGGNWMFNMQVGNGGFTDMGLTDENVTDGRAALKFTKEAGTLSINFPSNQKGYSEIVTKTGYWAVDIYIPENSDAKMNYHTTTYSGVTLKKGAWTTIYVNGSKNQVIITDTTGGTYKIDNIRSITAEEYNLGGLSFEANASGLRNHELDKINYEADGTTFKSNAGVAYYYGGADHTANTFSFAFSEGNTSNDKNVIKSIGFSNEIVHDGTYSLVFEKGTGYMSLMMRNDSTAYSVLKDGFTFWIYSTVGLNGRTANNFINGCNNKFNGGAGMIVPANTWTKVTVTKADMNPTRFLILQGSMVGTIYLDGFQPLSGDNVQTSENYTITYDAGEHGSVDSTTQTVAFGEAYTLKTPNTNRIFLGWQDETGYIYDMSGVWTLKKNVSLTAVYQEATYYYNATVESENEDGSISGLALNAGTHTAGANAMPTASEHASDMAYYRFNGTYGLNDFLVFDVTGDNMPIISFFTKNVTTSVYNHAQSEDEKGWLFFNGIFNQNGLPDGGYAGALSNRLNLIGPYKITYRADNSWNEGSVGRESPKSTRASDGSSPTNPNPVSLAKLQGSTDEYRVIIGWVESGSNMTLRLLVWNLMTSDTVYDKSFGSVAKADWEGDIVLYGHFGRTTVVNTVYPIEEDKSIDDVIEMYKPNMLVYKGEWDGNKLTLAKSYYESNGVSKPKAGTTDMSYIAFNGDYGVGDYLVFDFTGENMPVVSFFNNKVTNTVYNNGDSTANSTAMADGNAHGIMICGGMYTMQGVSGLGNVGTANACRLIIVGYQKVLSWDDNSNSNVGGYRTSDGTPDSPNPLSITALQDVTDTYRVIMGFSAKGTLEVYVINMVTGKKVYSWTKTGLTSKLEAGSIALHGQFGKTTVLDQVFGVEEDTTMDALIAKYGKDADYSDEADVTLDRYAYSSLSDGQWTLDGTDKVANPTDYRTMDSTYTTYKNAGFNIVLAQDMIGTDGSKTTWEASANKTYMDKAYAAGLKVILTDWHLQILSAPIKVSGNSAPAASDKTYTPWIIGTDANATSGEAANYLSYLSSLNITPNTTRFANRDALDKFVLEQLAPYKDHPAFYGVMLADEPSYHNAYCYGEIYKSIKRVMPECYVQYNLLPMEHNFSTIQYRYPGVRAIGSSISNAQIETAYKSYLESFLDAMGTDYIQYDDYPFKSAEEGFLFWTETNPHIDPTSLRNIQIVAEIAKERGLDVKVVTQSCLMKSGGADGAVHIRQITENDARWLNNYLMGFGVKQINYYTYWTKSANSSSGEYFVDGGSFVNRDGTTTALYNFMKTIMADNNKFAPTISHFDYNESQVFGSNNGSQNNDHISWSSSLTAAKTFKWLKGITTSKEYTLVTELYDAKNYNYMYMVMNTIDPNEGGTQSVTITLDSSITKFYVYDQFGDRTEHTGNTYTVSLTAGQAIYILPY